MPTPVFCLFCSETGDERVLPVLEAMTAFFEGQDNVTAGYSLQGRHLAKFCHLSFTAPVCCLFKVGRGQVSGFDLLLPWDVIAPTSAACPSPPPSAACSRLAVAHDVNLRRYRRLL